MKYLHVWERVDDFHKIVTTQHLCGTFHFIKCTTVIELTKRFQHFIWITLTHRLCIIIKYMRNLQTSAIDKFYFFAKQKTSNVRNWMLILENVQQGPEAKTRSFNQITNNDTRTHLPVFLGWRMLWLFDE